MTCWEMCCWLSHSPAWPLSHHAPSPAEIPQSHEGVWAGESCEEQLLLKEIVDASGAFFPLSVSHLSADVASNPVAARGGEETPSPLASSTGVAQRKAKGRPTTALRLNLT